MYALMGNVAFDMNKPLGNDKDGNPVMIADLWFDSDELVKI